MNTQLLEAIRTIIREELKPVYLRLNEQDYKLDAILEAWQIQKRHQSKLVDHEHRIRHIEHRLPAIR